MSEIFLGQNQFEPIRFLSKLISSYDIILIASFLLQITRSKKLPIFALTKETLYAKFSFCANKKPDLKKKSFLANTGEIFITKLTQVCIS